MLLMTGVGASAQPLFSGDINDYAMDNFRAKAR